MTERAASDPRQRRLHVLLLLLVAVVVPAESWIDGTGSRAWTMYSRSAGYRLRILAEDGTRKRYVSASALADRCDGDLREALAGADALRFGPQGFSLRPRLAELAGLACTVTRAARVTLTLSVRDRVDAPVTETSATLNCGGR